MEEKYLSKEIFKNAKADYLSREELLKVIRKYKRTKDQKEKDRLRDVVVNSNIRLVIGLSHGYAKRTNTSPDDLFQNGIIGVIVALDKFKVAKGYAFSTYAVPWINKYISDAVAGSAVISTKRFLSGSPQALLYKRLFIKSKGDNDKFINLLRENKISRKIQDRIEHVMGVSQTTAFIDLYTQIGESDQRIIDVIEDKEAKSPHDLASENILSHKIRDLIDKRLTEKERGVINSIYFDGLNIKATAARVGVSSHRVNILGYKAIKKLTSFFSDVKKRDSIPEFFIPEKTGPPIPIKDLVSPENIKKYLRSYSGEQPDISSMPLHSYHVSHTNERYIYNGSKEIFKVLAPTMRGAINFIRDKTHLYNDLEVVKMDGSLFPFSTPEYKTRDMSKPMTKRVQEEVRASRWEELPNGSF